MRSGVCFRCPNCGLPVMARRRQVGSRQHCPRCQIVLTVPSEQEVRQRDERIASVGEYHLAAADKPPQPAASVTLVCQHCQSPISVASDRAAALVSCPRCGAVVAVPPPLPQTSCAPAVEIYALADSSDGSAPASQEEYIAVNCPVCHTRLMGMRWQIGRKIVCPDCGTRVRVPEPLVKLRPQWDRSPGRDYLVSPPIELPHHEVLLPGAADEARAREESLEGLSSPPPESEAAAEPPLPAPRLRTFFAGVFTFPLYREALPWWAMLSAGGLLIQAVLHQAVRYAGQPSFFTYIGAMLMGGMGAVLCLVLLVPATAIWLAVLQRTSDGYDHFDDWLDSVWLDWLLDGLFILNSAALSVLPGAAVARLAGFAPEATLLAEAAVAMVLFPVVLLSMMHQASAWRPWSPAIARSLWRARWGWLCFYLATIVLAALAAGMLWLVLQGGIWTAALAVPGLAAMSLIYFRLLGRLAWYGAGHGL